MNLSKIPSISVNNSKTTKNKPKLMNKIASGGNLADVIL
jgi:hypothetical protein